MEDYLTKGETSGAKKAGWIAIAIISPVVLILIAGILVFPVMIILLLCKCTKCLCCVKEDPSKPQDAASTEKLEKCRRHIKAGSICLIISVLIAGIVWVIYAFMMLKSFGKTQCATSRLFNNVIRGVKEPDFVFGGLEGLKFFWENVSEEIGFLTPTLVPVPNSDGAISDGSALNSAITAYYMNFKDSTVKKCTNTAQSLKPDIVIRLQSTINQYIPEETTQIIEAVVKSERGAEAANRISTGGALITYRLALAAFGGKFDEFIANMTTFEDKFKKSTNWNENEVFGKIALIVVIVSVLSLTGLYVCLMSCTLNGKCLTVGNCLQSILAVLKLSFGIVISALAVITIILSVFVVNGCVLA